MTKLINFSSHFSMNKQGEFSMKTFENLQLYYKILIGGNSKL